MSPIGARKSLRRGGRGQGRRFLSACRWWIVRYLTPERGKTAFQSPQKSDALENIRDLRQKEKNAYQPNEDRQAER